MSIVCGVDLSESSWRAADVAAQLAAKLHLPLHLVHALAEWPQAAYEADRAGVIAAARANMEKRTADLARRGAKVEVHVDIAEPERVILQVAEAQGAHMVVVGSTGQGRGGGQPVGRHSERLAQLARVPVFLVRAPEALQQWLEGSRALKVVVGVDLDSVSEEAWNWTTQLERAGRVDRTAVHVYWPPNVFAKLGLGGVRSFIDIDPEVDRVLRRELAERFHGTAGTPPKLRVEPGIGRLADHLMVIAAEEKADLLVVGTHRRSTAARLWEGSVSRSVVHGSRTAVACVPLPARKHVHASPDVRIALAATDFSDIGNAAVEHAFAQVGPGGTVYLAHVLDPKAHASEIEPRDIFVPSPASAEAQKQAIEKLKALVPVRALLCDKTAEPLVLESKDVGRALAQAAERVGADVICVGTHGRTGVSRAILGSVAQGVVGNTQRPVLLVRQPTS